jgi:hypothetical protein
MEDFFDSQEATAVIPLKTAKKFDIDSDLTRFR